MFKLYIVWASALSSSSASGWCGGLAIEGRPSSFAGGPSREPCLPPIDVKARLDAGVVNSGVLPFNGPLQIEKQEAAERVHGTQAAGSNLEGGGLAGE